MRPLQVRIAPSEGWSAAARQGDGHRRAPSELGVGGHARVQRRSLHRAVRHVYSDDRIALAGGAAAYLAANQLAGRADASRARRLCSRAVWAPPSPSH